MMTIHKDGDCTGHCPFHNPSDHHMTEWRKHIRYDKFCLVERTCEHGIGHPDPDSASFIAEVNPQASGSIWIHSCDGCCYPK